MRLSTDIPGRRRGVTVRVIHGYTVHINDVNNTLPVGIAVIWIVIIPVLHASDPFRVPIGQAVHTEHAYHTRGGLLGAAISKRGQRVFPQVAKRRGHARRRVRCPICRHFRFGSRHGVVIDLRDDALPVLALELAPRVRRRVRPLRTLRLVHGYADVLRRCPGRVVHLGRIAVASQSVGVLYPRVVGLPVLARLALYLRHLPCSPHTIALLPHGHPHIIRCGGIVPKFR